MQIALNEEERKQLYEEVKQEMINAINSSIKDITNLYSDLPPLATKKEVKDILHIGDGTLNQWIREGLPLTQTVNGSYRITKEDITEFLSKKKFNY